MKKKKSSVPTILIAESDSTILKPLEAFLEKEGYLVISAGDGHRAFEYALQAVPDLIVSDTSLPKMDGFDLCQQIIQHSTTASIPIVLLATTEEPTWIFKGFQNGAAGYLSPPFASKHTLHQIQRLLSVSVEEHPGTPHTLTNNFEDISLLDLLHICREERLNGTIFLTKLGQNNQIVLNAGEITSVQLDTFPEHDTLNEMLQWKWKEKYFAVESEEWEVEEGEEERSEALQEDTHIRPKISDPQGQPTTGKEVSRMATRSEQLQMVLQEIKAELKEAEMVAIVASDGSVFATNAADADATKVGAMIATFLGLSKRACQTLKKGEPVEGLIKGEEGYIAIYPAGKKADLGVTTQTTANLAMLNMVCREAAEKIRAILG